LVSPDGALAIVPWEMLLVNGKYVVENHTVSYVISGRQLLRRPTHRKPGMSVVVADPDFDALVTGPKDLVGAEDSASRQAYRAESISLGTLRLGQVVSSPRHERGSKESHVKTFGVRGRAKGCRSPRQGCSKS